MKRTIFYLAVLTSLLAGPGQVRAAVQATTNTPPKPIIHKKGTVGLELCETTPFVFKGKLYRLEWRRSEGERWVKSTPKSYLRIMDHDTGREVSGFGEKHRFASAFVENDKVYVVGTKETAGWCGNVLTLFTSEDLVHWTEQTAFTLTESGVNICNTSVCKTGDGYAMSIELTQPGGFPARFLKSEDLVHWTLYPPECKHALGRYNAPHCLRWHDGWFYLLYLEADKPHGYETYVTRSRDLIKWEPSRLNPVLVASPEDKQILNPRLTEPQRAHVAKAIDINNSDIDFCEFNGRLIINYNWGNQGDEYEFVGEAEFAGTEAEFLTGWFPLSDAARLSSEGRVLVYTRNQAGKNLYVHDNIPASVAAIKQLGLEHGFEVDVSEDPAAFTEAKLKRYKAIVFDNTNNEILENESQKAALQGYIRAGGGMVGIHSASGSMRQWPWFWSALGGKFNRHARMQTFTVKVKDASNISTAHWPVSFQWTDEFYYTDHMPSDLHVLLAGDLTGLDDPEKAKHKEFGNEFPLAWCHQFDGGREWYTALGHQKEHYSDPQFTRHLLGGILWAMGQEKPE